VDPRADLCGGIYDLSLPIYALSDKIVAQGDSASDWQAMESRINGFLEEERVRTVMLQEYLKALAVHTE